MEVQPHEYITAGVEQGAAMKTETDQPLVGIDLTHPAASARLLDRLIELDAERSAAYHELLTSLPTTLIPALHRLLDASQRRDLMGGARHVLKRHPTPPESFVLLAQIEQLQAELKLSKTRRNRATNHHRRTTENLNAEVERLSGLADGLETF